MTEQCHVDSCLNEPFRFIQKPPDLLRFVFPALAVVKPLDAVDLMLAAQLGNGEAFCPVEGVDAQGLILPLCVGFQHEVHFLLEHLPAGGLGQPPDVHLRGAALAVQKYRSRQLCRQRGLSHALRSVDDQFHADTGLNAVCFFKIHVAFSSLSSTILQIL